MQERDELKAGAHCEGCLSPNWRGVLKRHKSTIFREIKRNIPGLIDAFPKKVCWILRHGGLSSDHTTAAKSRQRKA